MPSIFLLSCFTFSLFCPFTVFLLLFVPATFYLFDILRFDAMYIQSLATRYFTIRYSAISIFCGYDIIRLRYFDFRYVALGICDSMFCVSIFCHGSIFCPYSPTPTPPLSEMWQRPRNRSGPVWCLQRPDSLSPPLCMADVTDEAR